MIIRVIDFETTGLPENGAQICEVGSVDIELHDDPKRSPVIGNLRSFFCNPGVPMPPEARAIHHISDEDVAMAPSPEVVLATLSFGVDGFAAHNAKFEQHWFKPELPFLCTYKIALRLWPDAPSHSNQCLRYFLGMDLASESAMPPHRAAPDAFVTAHLLARELSEGRASFEDMLRWSAGPPLLPKVNFGKHFGEKWADVPTDYLDWIANKSDMDGDIKANARHHLKMRSAA